MNGSHRYTLTQKQLDKLDKSLKSVFPLTPNFYFLEFILGKSSEKCAHMYAQGYLSEWKLDTGQPRWRSGLAPPSAQGVILGTQDRVPRRAPCVEPASPSASLSLCLSWVNKWVKSLKEKLNSSEAGRDQNSISISKYLLKDFSQQTVRQKLCFYIWRDRLVIEIRESALMNYLPCARASVRWQKFHFFHLF